MDRLEAQPAPVAGGRQARRLSHRPGWCEGEWACAHGLCPVRAVRLWVRAAQAAHLPRLRCPLCLRALVFRRWRAALCLAARGGKS
jgi:hypothetical protein